MKFPFSEIEEKIGYTFRNKELLLEAFTHSTYANLHGGKDNERLEYLGDSVLQLIVTEWQYLRDEKAREGVLTKERQKLVCKEALDSAVEALGIERYLLTEGSRWNVSKKSVSSLFESLTAAIYLDGGYEAAKSFVLQYGNLHTETEVDNPKGALQEFLQKRGEDVPQYRVEKSGQDHIPFFRCEVSAMGESARGEGRSRKEAETTAAARLLWELSRSTPTEKRGKNSKK